MATDALPGHVSGRPAEPARGRRWGLPQYLALLALPILLLEGWTIISWLLDGPSQITEYRSEGKGREWWGARGFEAGVIVLSIWVITRLVRDCRRQGRILTFDVMFCIVGASLLWVNAGNNLFAPMFTISSAFVNLNDTCGHNPLIVNPDCGRFANPMIFLWGFEIFGILACSMLLGSVVTKLRARRPDMSTPKLFAIVCAGGCLMVLGEPALLLPLHLWTFPGTPLSVEVVDGFRYPLFPEILVFGLWIGIIAAIRIFKDDRGEAFVEKGLQAYSGRMRAVITMRTCPPTCGTGCATAPATAARATAPAPARPATGCRSATRCPGTRRERALTAPSPPDRIMRQRASKSSRAERIRP